MKTLEKIINPIKRFGIILLAGGILASFSPFSAECLDKERRFGFGMEIGVPYTAGLLVEDHVGNIPLEIRDVPKHPDDTYAKDKNVAPIEPDYVNLSGTGSLRSFAGTAGRVEGRVSITNRINAYLGLDFGGYNKYSDKIRRNYTNHPGTDIKGEGAALTFYELSLVFSPKISLEIETKITENTSIGLGYGFFKGNLKAHNGWDRFSEYQYRKGYDLANLQFGTPYLSLKRSLVREKNGQIYLNLESGLIFLTKKEITDLGKQLDMKINEKIFFIGLRIGARC